MELTDLGRGTLPGALVGGWVCLGCYTLRLLPGRDWWWPRLLCGEGWSRERETQYARLSGTRVKVTGARTRLIGLRLSPGPMADAGVSALS